MPFVPPLGTRPSSQVNRKPVLADKGSAPPHPTMPSDTIGSIMPTWILITAAIADILFFPIAAVITVVALRRSVLTVREKQLMAGAIVFSILAKIAVATLGHNFDVDSWRLTSDLLNQGKSVYANTYRFDYGPVWSLSLSGFGHLTTGSGERFHVCLAAFLATVDVLTAVIIARVYSWPAQRYSCSRRLAC
jgi:hypothetical protein